MAVHVARLATSRESAEPTGGDGGGSYSSCCSFGCGGGLHINGIRNDTYDLHSYTSEVSGMVVGLSFNLMYYGPSSSTQGPWSDDGREDR